VVECRLLLDLDKFFDGADGLGACDLDLEDMTKVVALD